MQALNEEQTVQRDAFMERLLQSAGGLLDIFTIYIGDQLGYYKALAGSSGLTSVELAEQTETEERYAREWLEQQTVTAVIQVEDETAGPTERRFTLSAAHAEVLTEQDSLNYLAPLALIAAGAVRPIDLLLKAFKNGGGVPYSEYGEVFVDGQGGINRAMFLQELGQDWLPSIADVNARLQDDSPALVADIGCGVGWSSIGMAQAYPNIRVDGFDLDQPSIAAAVANAEEADLNGRVHFQVRDAGDPTLVGRYDLVTAFECIHDMSDPVSALRTMRKMTNENGAVIIADERVGDTFTATGNDVEWIMYGWSVLHCLPVGMADHPSVGTGAVMRTDTLRQYALEAGFSDLEVLPIENFFFRIYRLIP
jgi:2-polyprenyl-3-methyl-5-hydroxy-6-metoxy-1,4-benzoquinol methylase